ncbi:MAG: hypothetical protein IJE88_03665 [Akkermansia sp.]|nr:hypothetical protein [Akkermansia sp.]
MASPLAKASIFSACWRARFSSCRAVYVGILIVGTIIFAGIPFLIYSMRRPSWADSKAVAEFEPFSWEKKR